MAHAQLSRAGTGFSATPSTPNTSSSADRKEFDTVWKDLKEQVIKLAGGDQTRIRKLEIEDVLATLDAISKEKAEKEANDKYRRLKDVTLTTLQCIQTVGGMIAEGASEVWKNWNLVRGKKILVLTLICRHLDRPRCASTR